MNNLKTARIEIKESVLLSSGIGKLLLSLLLSYVFLFLTGYLETYTSSAFSCQGWPLCMPQNAIGWLSVIHRLMSGLVVVLTGLVIVDVWKKFRNMTYMIVLVTAFGVMLAAQTLIGAQLGTLESAVALVVHRVTAISSWVVLLSLLAVTMVTTPERSTAGIEASGSPATTRTALNFLKDLLTLTKPIVVALLLVTTFAGMVIGLQAMPSLGLVFWTLLGGFLAAGGSGAINQYIDRADDQKMQRTQNRPLPAGRMEPGEALAFGVGMTLASLYIMLVFVNLMAAILTLVGIVYYVLLYSILLKKSTVQNIVIGGGAGAIPPLVGWAAVTGTLEPTSLLLFAVVFIWTPPHFWALALVRMKDYARAGVPMLPVIRGEAETRLQILIYTTVLVVSSLLLPVFGLGSVIYLAGAVLLGTWLFLSAYKLWKKGGNKLAWKMYRYSSMYLALLFMILMIDRVIL